MPVGMSNWDDNMRTISVLFRTMRKNIGVKVHQKIGSSLAEMLITVLLMGIVLSAVASGTGALIQCYRKIVLKSEAMTLMSMITNSINGELKNITRFERIDFMGDDGVTIVSPPVDGSACYLKEFQSGLRNYRLSIANGLLSENGGNAVLLPTSTDSDGERTTDEFYAIVCKPSKSTDVLPLVSGASYTGKLKARLVPQVEGKPGTQIKYDSSTGLFSYKVQIADRTLDGFEHCLAEQECMVRSMNE